MSERQDAYKVATDGYVEMVRKVARLRQDHADVPTVALAHEHIIAIARFLTEATVAQEPSDDTGPDYSTTDAMTERSDPYAPPIGFTGPEWPGITYDHQEDE